MRSLFQALAWAAALGMVISVLACGNLPQRGPIDTLDGEVTVHGFADWTHAWGVFVEPGVPASSVHLDTMLALPLAPAATVGPCTILPSPRCPQGCAPGTFCQTGGACEPAPAWTFLDEGAVTVSGGQGGIAVERLAFDAATGLYASTPPAGSGRFIAGGERVTVSFASGVAPTDSSLRAPTPVEDVVVPSPLRFAPTGFHVGWTPGRAELIEILLVASNGVDTTTVRCLSDDGGAFDVPAAAIAAMPPAPRALHFEVTRSTEELLPTRGTHGVRVHTGFTFVVEGSE
jgi:hypothetical protein